MACHVCDCMSCMYADVHAHACLLPGPDEDYQVMTRGKLLDRMKLAVAGSIATRVIIGEETNFAIAGERQLVAHT